MQRTDLLKSVFDAIQDGISVLDKDLTIVQVNPTMERWYRDLSPLRGKKCYQVYQNRTSPCNFCPAKKALRSKTLKMATVPWKKDGHVQGWLELFAFPMLDGEGRVSGVVEYVRNVTDRIIAEKALNTAHEQLEQQIEARTTQWRRANRQLKREIIERQRVETELRRRDSILEAVAYAAERFLQGAPVAHGLQGILAKLGRAADVSRVYIFENEKDPQDGLLTSLRHEWVAEGISAQLDDPCMHRISFEHMGFQRWTQLLKRGMAVFGRVLEFPESEQAFLLRQSIQALVVAPIFVDDVWWGFIGFDDCTEARRWSSMEIDALYTAGNIIGAALRRKRNEERISTLSREMLKAQDYERKNISNYLHDKVAQDLGTAKIRCLNLMNGSTLLPKKIGNQIRSVSEVLEASIAAIRDLAYNLRPPGLDQLGLVSALYMHCDEFSRRTDISVDFHAAGISNITLDAEMEINLYRLIQEGLANVEQHARATRVYIRLVASYPHLILRLIDNGVGFDVQERLNEAAMEKRMGLRSMQDRATLLGGELVVTAFPGKGTKIALEIPIHHLLVNADAASKELSQA
ncbi:MAG: PAS domain-containing protein [Desulfosarcinaceae bacterium]|nr:PAS domain-containing protein [Desulfosarcinaceae bacterium]